MSTDVLSISLADISRLEDVVDREALGEVCRSFHDLFGISIRVFSREGGLLADVHVEQPVCGYVNTLPDGRRACAATVADVRAVDPQDGEIMHPCFTGAVYRVVPIEYHGRRVGRFVIGPYLPAETREVPRSLLDVDPGIDPERARTTLAGIPRVRSETADRLVQHLRRIIDLILFSSHRAHLTSEMHVASVRESYRELAEKTSQLQQAYERLKELDRLKSNFLATVSHELRTPLTSIIGYSEMLDTGIAGNINEEQREFVQTIHSKGEHLLALITNLLDLGKLEQGTVSLRLVDLDTAALFADVARTVAPQAHKKNVSVEVDVPADLPKLCGDPVRIRQVLFNLAENAVKFTPENGAVYLRARATELEGGDEDGFGAVLMATPRKAIELEVRDTGIGIAPPEQERVFDAFYQVDGSSTREHGGAGLGLSIAKRLVDAHGGSIRVESTPGTGTAFYVTLPENDVGESYVP